MTRKDFEVVAGAMKWARPDALDPQLQAKAEQWDETLNVMLVELDKTNANFNADRFVEACGGRFKN